LAIFQTGEKNSNTKVHLLQSQFIAEDSTILLFTKTQPPRQVEMYSMCHIHTEQSFADNWEMHKTVDNIPLKHSEPFVPGALT
jgi:hypothetical protein